MAPLPTSGRPTTPQQRHWITVATVGSCSCEGSFHSRPSMHRAESVTAVRQNGLSRAKHVLISPHYASADAFGPLVPAKQMGCTDGHRRRLSSWEVHTTACMALAVCKRCSGIDSRSEGVVDVLAAMLERDERAAHASQAGRLGTECVTLGEWEGKGDVTGTEVVAHPQERAMPTSHRPQATVARL